MQQVLKKYGKIMLFPGIVCLILLYVFLQQDTSNEEETPSITTIPQQQDEEVTSHTAAETEAIEQPMVARIMVDVKGAVQHPGVYELTTEERVIDAIERAGGYKEDAQTIGINHAQKLQDEMVIYIPVIGEDAENTSPTVQVVSTVDTSSASSNDQVNLNNADEAALTTLPGIGASKAQAIIAYREENGPFQNIEDLKNISGIGDKTFEKLKEYIVVK